MPQEQIALGFLEERSDIEKLKLTMVQIGESQASINAKPVGQVV